MFRTGCRILQAARNRAGCHRPSVRAHGLHPAGELTAAAQVAIRYRPSWPLGCFVGTIWYYEGWTQPHAFERLMPDGMMALVVNLDDDLCGFTIRSTSRSTTVSPARLSWERTTGSSSSIQPSSEMFWGAVPPRRRVPFLGMPADELGHRHVSLEDVWGSGARLLRERFLAIPCRRERCRLVEGNCSPVPRPARTEARSLLRGVGPGARIGHRGRRDRSNRPERPPVLGTLPDRRRPHAQGLFEGAPISVGPPRSNRRARARTGPRSPCPAAISTSPTSTTISAPFRELIPSNYAAIDKRHMNHVPIL